jgi:hypothetical protein
VCVCAQQFIYSLSSLLPDKSFLGELDIPDNYSPNLAGRSTLSRGFALFVSFALSFFLFGLAAHAASPSIISNGGGLYAVVTVAENQTAVTAVIASDGDTVTFTESGAGLGKRICLGPSGRLVDEPVVREFFFGQERMAAARDDRLAFRGGRRRGRGLVLAGKSRLALDG